MAIGTTETGIKLEAVNAYWGTKHCRSIEAVATASLSAGSYVDINYINFEHEEVLGYIWFDDGVESDPAPSGRTLIAAIDISVGSETAAENATAIQAALDASDFLEAIVSTASSETVIAENIVIGKITEETDPDTFGGTVTTLIEARGGFLGKTAQGGSTVSLETQTFEIKADQDGETLLDDINLGNAISAEMGLIQVTKERLAAIIGGVVGGNHTPTSGTELTGFGTSRLFQSMAAIGGQLILHPIRLIATDHSSDVIFHKCAPLPNDINYSGTENQVLNVTFKAYNDENVDSSISSMAIGDWTQDLA